MFDPEAYRADSRERWERAAEGWARHRDAMQRAALPVSRWMVEAIHPQPGHLVLELAAGLGDTGLLAAEMVRPGGEVIVTDGATAMVEAAREHAAEIGATNVSFRPMEAEWIDLEAASVDGVLCRWGYMLLVDPEAALRETRRVLRPGGRVALAVWDAIEHNPWIGAGRAGARASGVLAPPEPGGPDPFALSAPGRVEELLETAGFDEIEVEPLEFDMTAPDLDSWWVYFTQTSPSMREAVGALSPADHYRLRESVDEAYAPYVEPDGTVRLPARTLVAAASA